MEKQSLRVIAGDSAHPLKMGDEIEISCYVLENENRVITQAGLLRAFGFMRGASQKSIDAETRTSLSEFPIREPNNRSKDVEIPRFVGRRWLQPYIDDKILSMLKSPIEFKTPAITYGYEAEVLIEIANAILTAFQEGATTSRQLTIVKRAQTIVSASAKTGIVALIDEVTGYQTQRNDRALQRFFNKFLTDDPVKWKKTFQDEYYEQIYRLRGWEWPKRWKNHPQVVGRWTIEAVYDRIAPTLTHELEKRNPILESGSRDHKHHQHFSPDLGNPELQKHLYAITSLMRACTTWNEFERIANRSFPIPGTNMEITFPGFDSSN